MTSPIEVNFAPPQASAFAADYDLLFWYITAVITVGGGLVYVLVTYFCFKHARRAGDKTPRILGSTKLELMWTIIPTMFFLSFFVWGTKLFNKVVDIPKDAPEIYVVGKRWMWKIQHPDGVREINELHLKVGEPVKITAVSEDVIHDFGIPAFRNKMDVVPGRYMSTWYHPTLPGTYHIFCDQYCGQGHSQMVGKVHVLTADDYAKWKEGTYRIRDGKKAVDGSAAWLGEQLFRKLNCISCHGSDTNQRAPRLDGIYGSKVPIGNGQLADVTDAYLRESIRNPMAKIHEGWKPIMPAYPRSQLTEDELIQLVAYIKSLKPGDTPARVEHTPAQIGASTVNSEGGAK